MRGRPEGGWFVNSMSDLFHKEVPFNFIDKVFAVMAHCPQHTFQILTKRPERMAEYFSKNGPPLPNVWLGTSVESADVLHRIDELRECPASVRFLSLEPLIGDLGTINLDGIHWVIVGGESGPGARPMHPNWARSLRDQCVAAGVPFFFKQWGSLFPCEDKHRLVQSGHYCDVSHCWRGPGEGVAYKRIGKHKAGRLLDGRTWDEFPEVA